MLPIPSSLLIELESRFEPHLKLPDGEEVLPSQSLSIHALRVAGQTGRFADGVLTDSDAIARSFLDATFGEAVYGVVPLRRTRYGLRFLPPSIVARLNGRGTEVHDHQTLAALGELGFSLSTPVRLEGESFTLRDVLADALANLDLDKLELEWTVVALAAYVAPERRAWNDKFGRSWDFDDLAAGLLERGLEGGSCGGTHMLYAELFLLQADARFGLLQQPQRRRLEQAVRAAAIRLTESQNPDGSWSLGWHDPDRESVERGSGDERFLVTAHLGELSLYLPSDLRPPASALRRAGEWLLPELRERIATRMSDDLCPLTHAFCFVRGIADPSDPTGLDSEAGVFLQTTESE